VAPLLVVSALTLASAAAMAPLVRLAYAGRPELLPTVFFGMGALALLTPLTTLARCAVLGAAAWAVLVLLGASVRYRSVVSLLAYAQSILAAQAAWVVALLWMRGRSAFTVPADLTLSTALDAFLGSPGSTLGAIAPAIDPFQLLWIVAVGVGLAAVARTTRGRGLVAAVVVWALAVSVSVVRAWL